MRIVYAFGMLLAALTPAVIAQTAQPPFPGTIPVRSINTQELLSIMNAGTWSPVENQTTFIPVAAHRGFWRDVPENSLPSIAAAYNGGVEAVEIDVRLASQSATPYAPSTNGTYGVLQDTNAQLVLSHDECVDRISTGSGALRYNPKSTCSSSTGFTGAMFTALNLRDRHGNPTTYNPPTFQEALQTLEGYLSMGSNGDLYGPVLIVDLKDKDNTTGDYTAWNDYVYALSVMEDTLPAEEWPAVLFKMKMAGPIPSMAVFSSELGNHPTYGHLVFTINPEDAVNTAGYAWNGANFLQLWNYAFVSNPPYVQQFELVPNNQSDGAQNYLSSAVSENSQNTDNPYALTAWATYYQPSFYPEGVAERFGTCCYLATLLPAAGSQNMAGTDERGILDFATYYDDLVNPNDSGANFGRTSTITSDNLFETFNFLVGQDARDVSRIQ